MDPPAKLLSVASRNARHSASIAPPTQPSFRSLLELDVAAQPITVSAQLGHHPQTCDRTGTCLDV